MMEAANNANDDGKTELDQVLVSIEHYQSELDRDGEIREGIRAEMRELEKTFKKINFTIQGIHGNPSEENLKSIALKTQGSLETLVKPLIVNLNAKVPTGEYYKYNDSFRHTIQRLGYLAIFSNYMLNGNLCTINDTAKFLGLSSAENKSEEQTVFLDYDDYIVGLLELGSELSRFSRNCVTFGGSIKRVYGIHETMNQLTCGMHNITFKNDFMRRRYDALKYNIKVVEEVIYDLKLRGIEDSVKDLNVASASGDEKTDEK